MLTFICSYCKALENITFCIFQGSLSELKQRECIPTAFLTQVKQYGTIPIQTCCRASTRADSALWIHTWIPQHMNCLLCSEIQTCTSSKGTQKNPSGRGNEAFRARRRSHRKQRQDRTRLPAEEICPELSPFSSCRICLLYPWLKHGLTSPFTFHSH